MVGGKNDKRRNGHNYVSTISTCTHGRKNGRKERHGEERKEGMAGKWR
jgi:hypothetical protein